MVDVDYKFKYIDCGCNGRVSDGGVFKFNFILNFGVEYFLYFIRKIFIVEKYICVICYCWGWSIFIKILFDEIIFILKFGLK